jgi:Sec-independent protein translocase protein TatA
VRRVVLGLHFGDLVLLGIVVGIVFGWTLIPKLGELIGRLLSGDSRGSGGSSGSGDGGA